MFDDWKADDWNALGTCVYAAATVGLAAVGFVGVATWRRQLRGTSEYELARRLLRSVLVTRDSIVEARGIFMFGSESAARPGRDRADPNCSADDEAFAYSKRLERVGEAFRTLSIDLTEAKVLWPHSGLEKARGELLSVAYELQVAIQTFLSLRRREKLVPLTAAEGDRYTKAEAMVFNYGRTDDPFASRIEGAVDQFRAYLQPKLGVGRGRVIWLAAARTVGQLRAAVEDSQRGPD